MTRLNEAWDRRFLAMAKHVSGWSKDPSTKTGAVVVRPNKTVAALGYNGFPRGVDDADGLYANRDTKYSRIIHCEMNAVLSSRESMYGYTLYTWPFASCDRCAAHMIQAGVVRCVAPELPASLVDRWKESLDKSLSLFREAGVIVDFYNMEIENGKKTRETSGHGLDRPDSSRVDPFVADHPSQGEEAAPSLFNLPGFKA